MTARVVMLVLNDMSADARVDREADALGEAGHDVTVLALRGEGLPEEERRDRYRVLRVARAGAPSWRRPLRKAAASRARRHAMASAAALVAPDVVHCHDADSLPIGAEVAAKAGARLVYDAHELFLDMLAGHGRDSALVQSYWRRVERTLVPRAHLRITVSDPIAEELERRYGAAFEVVLNVPQVEPLLSTGRLRSELGVAEDVPVVLYQGGLIRGRGLVGLVEAMSGLEGAVLAVQGWGPEETAMRTRSVALGIAERVRFMGRMPMRALHEYACGADVGVVVYENVSLNNYLAAPNKLFAYMMAGLPVASNDFPGLRRVVEGESVGVVFDGSDPASIASALRGLIEHPEERRAMGERARRLAEARYNWDVESRKLLALYERLLSEGAR